MLKGAHDARIKEKKRKAEELEQARLQREQEEEMRTQDPAAWLTKARARRQELYERYERRAKRKLMGSQRRGGASSERMRAIISTLSGAEDKKRSADGCADDGSDFGDDDADWNVYRHISKDGEASESCSDADEELQAKLAHLDERILDVDPAHVPAVIRREEHEEVKRATAEYTSSLRRSVPLPHTLVG